VSNEEMQQAVNGNALDKGCKDLIELAKSRGGHDNITVQLLRVASDSMRKTQVDGVKSEPPAAKPSADAKTSEAKAAEAKIPEAKAPEAKAPEAKAPEAKDPDAKEPEASKKPEGSKDPEA